MAHSRSEVHHRRAEQADQLAAAARQRLADARAAAERHERVAHKGGDPGHEQRHRRAAEFYHEAELLYEVAARMQAEHAAHERRAAQMRRTPAPLSDTPSVAVADTPSAPVSPEFRSTMFSRYAALARQEVRADERDRTADERDRMADERDRMADERERIADDRDYIADDRERAADDREAVATSREDQIDARERRLDEARRVADDPREHLARAWAAIARSGDRLTRQERVLDGDDAAAAAEQAAIDRQIASTERPHLAG